ncbi:hypothetical protein [Candidatus Methanocrinis natronophilus]|uniref:Uncharacterized protein n=1 Tax=Candidatus Methanocrinis natronophilus TaxID=3033396 RepID=A0ABT5XAC0_9EURY|nr:hypothetical protein [Candidatus Methanocrinis natronophilus]MDF0591665.1 hypothetical protein [Candidatus Methanocrinis natronophilus]
MIAGYLNQVAKYEASPVLYGWAPVLATLTLSPPFSMDDPFKVEFRISSTLTFDVTITGTLDGEPQSDTLEFNAGWGDIVLITAKQFDTVTEITTTIGANERDCRVVAVDPTTEEELPGAWLEFPCRREAKRSTYLKVVEDQASQQIMQAEGRIFCTEPLEFGAKVKLDSGVIYEVVKVEPKAGLDGKELYRVLLLGGVGA